jgi:hypothetical protein
MGSMRPEVPLPPRDKVLASVYILFILGGKQNNIPLCDAVARLDGIVISDEENESPDWYWC